VALNLDVAFLHDVEEADLNFSGEVGKFVDGENAAIGARQQAIVNREFVREIASASRGANGVDVADDVSDGNVRCGEFFDKALVARHPCDGRVVSFSGNLLAAGATNRLERIVIDFAASDHRNLRIQ